MSDERETNLDPRTVAWNEVRFHAMEAAKQTRLPGDDRTDFWPKSAIACLLSLTMMELGRRISDAAGDRNHAGDGIQWCRLVSMMRECERLFATAEFFGLGASPGTADDDRDFTGLQQSP